VYPTELKKLVVVSNKNVHNFNNSNHKAPPSPPLSLLFLTISSMIPSMISDFFLTKIPFSSTNFVFVLISF
jgi:hypothetical protein